MDLFEQIISAAKQPFEMVGENHRLKELKRQMGLPPDAKIPNDEFIDFCQMKGLEAEKCVVIAVYLAAIGELEI